MHDGSRQRQRAIAASAGERVRGRAPLRGMREVSEVRRRKRFPDSLGSHAPSPRTTMSGIVAWIKELRLFTRCIVPLAVARRALAARVG